MLWRIYMVNAVKASKALPTCKLGKVTIGLNHPSRTVAIMQSAMHIATLPVAYALAI